MTSLDQLELFQHLAATLHFGRTAAECHVTPSTLSRTISRLEAETGVRLFDRDRRTVGLTPDGVRFLDTTHRVLTEWQRFGPTEPEEIVSGTLTLFCTVTASQTIVPSLLATFRATHPSVHLAIETGYAAEALERLRDGSVDVTIAALPARTPRDLLAHVITSTDMVLVVSSASGLTLPTSVSPAWSSVPFVLPETGLSRTLVDLWFRRLRVRPTVAAEAHGHEAVLALASLGCGVGIVPDLVAQQRPPGVDVVAVDVKLPSFRIAACTLPNYLEQRPTRALWHSLTGT
ncbi:MAG: LysR family transcriptional regulator, positive regulator for ilvC [Actinomycetota bacterium]|jgi:LysR family positive regulator for ilvC|nr:LysR family transcriptional regulator, positive regulator for ilvC [Actinomycetota bacterium]